jgi:hypothetical protein
MTNRHDENNTLPQIPAWIGTLPPRGARSPGRVRFGDGPAQFSHQAASDAPSCLLGRRRIAVAITTAGATPAAATNRGAPPM